MCAKFFLKRESESRMSAGAHLHCGILYTPRIAKIILTSMFADGFHNLVEGGDELRSVRW